MPTPDTNDPFLHPALFYSGSQEFLAGTMPFIDEALSKDEPLAVAVPKANLELLRKALGSSAERVLMIDMADAGANPGRIIPGVLRAFADAHADRHVRIIGEPIWRGRSDTEYPACAQHEALINYAFTGRSVTIMCPYDEDGLDPHMIADASKTHPFLVDRTGTRRSEQYDPDRVIAGYNEPLPRPPRTAIERDVEAATLDNARWFLTSYGRTVGLSASQLVDLEIAVTELITNSISHGGGSGTLRVWTDAGQLACEISDAGHITDPLVGRRPASEGQLRGRGLLLVNQVVDLVRMHTGRLGTTVRIYLRLPGRDLQAG
ncbi:anti-sigma factor RsbA family regulatory protein [Glycomyces tarimensis]